MKEYENKDFTRNYIQFLSTENLSAKTSYQVKLFRSHEPYIFRYFLTWQDTNFKYNLTKISNVFYILFDILKSKYL